MKTIYFIFGILLSAAVYSQDLRLRLANAMDKLENDSQFTHSQISMVVLDGATGKTIFERNGNVGLAPASCQKVITSASAFELLKPGYHFKTVLNYDGKLIGDSLTGNVYLAGYGDPTTGSWRWKETEEEQLIKRIINELSKSNIKKAGSFIIDHSIWGTETLPGGWVWEDIGNYYGAESYSFNWHENQYDIVLQAGKNVGDPVEILSAMPGGEMHYVNDLKTANRGTGDQAYVYHAPYSNISFLKGTIPQGTGPFIIKASLAGPDGYFLHKLSLELQKSGIRFKEIKPSFDNTRYDSGTKNSTRKPICIILSPSIDSINYWFLKKSVNLFGEAFVKTIAYEVTGNGSRDTGISIIRNYWAGKGIEKSALKILDGSGLSPSNRITSRALVQVMQFAKSCPWFRSFFNALPEMNGMRMKDGYIGGVRSYAGYAENKGIIKYTFSFIVNNFDGNPGLVREKIWGILNLLK